MIKNSSCCFLSKEIKENLFRKADVILHSFGTDLNITYLTKCKNSKYSGIYKVLKWPYIFHTFLNTLVII